MSKRFSLLVLFFFVALLPAARAQLSGTKTIPGDYATLTAAIADVQADCFVV